MSMHYVNYDIGKYRAAREQQGSSKGAAREQQGSNKGVTKE